ncbi:MAG TPA: hypothetical protein VGG92_18270 [Caulobacteraceae bacterium]
MPRTDSRLGPEAPDLSAEVPKFRSFTIEPVASERDRLAVILGGELNGAPDMVVCVKNVETVVGHGRDGE